jgi:hypothetical protein
MDKHLMEKVLEMSPVERIVFAELILASTEYEEEKIRAAWLNEVQLRMKSVQDGKSKLLDFEKILNENSNP